jgi:hypothetical protein
MTADQDESLQKLIFFSMQIIPGRAIKICRKIALGSQNIFAAVEGGFQIEYIFLHLGTVRDQ